MCWGLPILFPLMPVLSLRFFFLLIFPLFTYKLHSVDQQALRYVNPPSSCCSYFFPISSTGRVASDRKRTMQLSSFLP